MKLLNKSILLILFNIIPFFSCNFYGDKNLGNGYILARDGSYSEIDYGVYPVMHESVRYCNYNKSFIILMTTRSEKPPNVIREYWIIDKSIPVVLKDHVSQEEFNKLLRIGLTGPLDSLEFYRQLKNKKIDLQLNE